MKSITDIKHNIWIFRRRILIFLAVFGPATIAAMADNDAAGVATYLQAGAKLGYPILFILIIVTILLAITQEMGIRLAIISRKGLGDHIREKYGLKISIFVFSALLLANLGTITADVSAIKIISELFNLPSLITIVFLLVLASLFVVRGNYRINQTLMLLSSLFFLTFIFSAVKAKPDWGLALSNLFFPHGVTFDRTYLISFLVMGMSILGTTITPWGQFFIQSYVVDKGLNIKHYRIEKTEVYIGAFITNIVSFFIIISTATTLYKYGLRITDAKDAAMALQPLAGHFAQILFAFGLFCASMLGAFILPVATAYAVCEAFGWEYGFNTTWKTGRIFYSIILISIIIPAILVLIPSMPLIKVMVLSQDVNGILLPIILIFVMLIINDKKIMGEHTNRIIGNIIAWLTIAGIIIATAVLVVSSFF